jgi:hypothetical protein
MESSARIITRSGLSLMAAMAVALGGEAAAQSELGREMELLEAQRSNVNNSQTSVRVAAMYAIKDIALTTMHSPVKVKALSLLEGPVGSASDHIRLPAVYAIAEVANSADDPDVKLKALQSLAEPFGSEQLVARNVATDGLNLIMSHVDKTQASAVDVMTTALNLLLRAADSGNNGARMPAINSVWNTVAGCKVDRVYSLALDVLRRPIESRSMIGGMEVRFMAIEAIERIGVETKTLEIKEKAIQLLGGVPDTDKSRAQAATKRIYASM